MNEEPPEVGPEGSSEDPVGAFLQTYERARTREAYGHDLRAFFEQAAEQSPERSPEQPSGQVAPTRAEVAGVQPEEVAAFLERAREEKGPTAAKRRGAALRAFYRWAREEGIVSKETAETIREAARPESSE
jgi:site-specific recombinase XerD